VKLRSIVFFKDSLIIIIVVIDLICSASKVTRRCQSEMWI